MTVRGTIDNSPTVATDSPDMAAEIVSRIAASVTMIPAPSADAAVLVLSDAAATWTAPIADTDGAANSP